MKKQNISVALYLMGGNNVTAPASAYDQLLARRDIVYNYIPGVGDEDDPAKYIYPYHALNFAVITREPETVKAPTDAICGGAEEAGRFVVTPQEPLPAAVKSKNAGTCVINGVPFFNPVMTFDGQPLSINDFISGGGTAVVEGAVHVSELNIDYLPVDCDATSVTYTTTFTYQGESCDVTVTQQVSGS